MRKYAAGIVAGLIVAATAWADWIQYSDESPEGGVTLYNRSTALIEVKMPVACSTISKVRFYTMTGASIKLILYDQHRKSLWWRIKVYPLGEYWGEHPVAGNTLPAKSTFYVGWEGILGVNTKLGQDKTGKQFPQYMWLRDNQGRWRHPEWIQGKYNFMLGVYVTETPAVDPTSLGRVKALFR